MKKRIVYSLMLILFASGCECEDQVIKSTLPEGLLFSTLTKDCSGIEKSFKVSSDDYDGVFHLSYEDGKPSKEVSGHPWVQIVWNKSDYNFGDSVIMEMIFPEPPNFKLNFFASSDELDIDYYQLDGAFFVETLLDHPASEMYLEIQYFYMDSIWFKFGRIYDLSV